MLEVAAHDPKQGGIFYTLEQKPAAAPQLTRNDSCLACHLSWDTLGVPGFFMMSTLTVPDECIPTRRDSRTTTAEASTSGGAAGTSPATSARSSTWATYRSRRRARRRELSAADEVARRERRHGRLPAHTSDVVALMVLDHQAHMMNLITRTGWEGRLAQNGDASRSPASKRPPSISWTTCCSCTRRRSPAGPGTRASRRNSRPWVRPTLRDDRSGSSISTGAC